MFISYENIKKLMSKKGESFKSLVDRGVVTDYSSRRIDRGDYVDIKHIANLCRYFDIPIEEAVEVIHEP